jgi:hypothetical protein
MLTKSLFEQAKKADKIIQISYEDYFVFDKKTDSSTFNESKLNKDLKSMMNSDSWVLLFVDAPGGVGPTYNFVEKHFLKFLLK